jgi:hypothetical protein
VNEMIRAADTLTQRPRTVKTATEQVGYQGIVDPPLGRITMPVTNFAAGDAR